MAYIRELPQLPCGAPGCTKKRATHEVFNRVNASVGKFCKACAIRKQTKLHREELGLRPNEALIK